VSPSKVLLLVRDRRRTKTLAEIVAEASYDGDFLHTDLYEMAAA
jgi:hypothetical protein